MAQDSNLEYKSEDKLELMLEKWKQLDNENNGKEWIAKLSTNSIAWKAHSFETLLD